MRDEITQQELTPASVYGREHHPAYVAAATETGVREAFQTHAFDGRAYCVVLTRKEGGSLDAMMVDTEACRRQTLSAVKHGSAKGIVEEPHAHRRNPRKQENGSNRSNIYPNARTH